MAKYLLHDQSQVVARKEIYIHLYIYKYIHIYIHGGMYDMQSVARHCASFGL